jgi:hypothetical protein
MPVIINQGSWTEIECGRIRFRRITDEANEMGMKYEFQLITRQDMWGMSSSARWKTVLTINNFEQGYESCKQTLRKKEDDCF